MAKTSKAKEPTETAIEASAQRAVRRSIAAHALTGLLTSNYANPRPPRVIVQDAVRFADLLLTALEEPPAPPTE